MPQHLNCTLIFSFIKNNIKLLAVSVAAWRGGGHSDIQKANEHVNTGLSNVLRISVGGIFGEMYLIQNVDRIKDVNRC